MSEADFVYVLAVGPELVRVGVAAIETRLP